MKGKPRGTLRVVSEAAQRHDDGSVGTSLLAPDLDAASLEAAPVLASLDELLIEDLSADEDEAFFTALGT